MKISITQAKDRLKEANNELYYRKETIGNTAHYGVRDIPLEDKILLFEEIKGLEKFIKKQKRK